LQKLRATASRVEQLYAVDKMTITDLSSVYEGLFLRCITGVEAYLEDMFYGIVLGRIYYPRRRGVSARVSVPTRPMLNDIIKQGRPYVPWLPYDHTLTLANAYLRAGRPFTGLSQTSKGELQKWVTTRHAIAHASDSAKQAFERKVIANMALPPAQRNPVGYLRAQARINPAASRFDLVLDGVVTLVSELDP